MTSTIAKKGHPILRDTIDAEFICSEAETGLTKKVRSALLVLPSMSAASTVIVTAQTIGYGPNFLFGGVVCLAALFSSCA